jgi:NedA-like, galactose-binding domain/LiaF transmembrane domain
MTDRKGPEIRARRQERVAKVVWGSLFVVMGVLFTLHDMGRINLGEPVNPLSPDHAVDGDDKTRWGSAFRNQQWLMVDLGASVPLSKVRLSWENAYAKDYDLQVSNDGILWNTVRRVTGGNGGVEDQEVGQTARYVRVLGLRRATPYGISLYELQVFDSDGQLISQGKRATASSVEDQVAFALWFRFWPLLLVAGGLPLLLAPRNDANQVFGLVLTAMGAFVQLQNLALVPWGVRQTSALVLVLVGVVILLQSLRRSEESGTGSSGDAL